MKLTSHENCNKRISFLNISNKLCKSCTVVNSSYWAAPCQHCWWHWVILSIHIYHITNFFTTLADLLIKIKISYCKLTQVITCPGFKPSTCVTTFWWFQFICLGHNELYPHKNYMFSWVIQLNIEIFHTLHDSDKLKFLCCWRLL